jgi:hypothetical protein
VPLSFAERERLAQEIVDEIRGGNPQDGDAGIAVKKPRIPNLNRGSAAIALIYSCLGEKAAAISWLEKAKAEDDPKISDPGFERLRSDSRFNILEARLRPNPSCPAF